ncbi:MAG: molybdopterin cofactor-binding domain-containing protein [Thermoanaerobaculia bacterium]
MSRPRRPLSPALDRRTFLGAGAALAGALLLEWPSLALEPATPAATPFRPNGYLRIDPDGQVTISAPTAEIGQGVKTAIPMLVAEELEVTWESIRVVQAAWDPSAFEAQGAGGSSTIFGDAWIPARTAGAAAREMLVSAAAAHWAVDAAACRAERGTVVHPPTGRRLAYGELAAAAARRPVPEHPKLKQRGEFQLIGRRIGTVDALDIVTGRARYASDARLPGMLYAAVARSPVFRGRVRSFDAAAALAIPGVRRVIPYDGAGSPIVLVPGVAVLADSTWAALRGREALRVEWDEGEFAGESSASLDRQIEELLTRDGERLVDDGDAPAAIAGAARTFEATYHLPFLAHMAMEPLTCTAELKDGRLRLIPATQSPAGAAGAAQAATGIAAESIAVELPRVGGGFGRRLLNDYSAEAARIAQLAGVPVKLVSSREDDLRHDFYRTRAAHRLRAGVDAGGRLVAWHLHSVSASRYGYRQANRPPSDSEVLASDPPRHLLPDVRIEWSALRTGVPTGAYRAPRHNDQAFAVESFLDEIARGLGRDPLVLRLELYAGDGETPYDDHGGPVFRASRMRAVLERAAAEAGWGGALPAGRGRGIASHFTFGTYVAAVVEVTLRGLALRVDRVVAAVDCGPVVNRSGLEAQIEGGFLDGLSSAMFGGVTIENGRAVEGNFDAYPLMRMHQAPRFELHVLETDFDIRGAGEPGLPPAAPALVNAIVAAGGERVRRLPLSRHGFEL